ncbi:MAG: hypothetical protein CSA97_00580 [Bacteroidetes bacterium]|nr:MAG: hypothetical protein CSA97_00580 [Bacteroidota bacterium]
MATDSSMGNKGKASSIRLWWQLPLLLGWRREKGGRISQTYILIAIIAVALSIAAMVLSIAVGKGFQEAIRHRLVGFVGDIQILRLDTNTSFEQKPMFRSSLNPEDIAGIEGVTGVSTFAIKPGIIKTKGDMQGCVLRGVDGARDLQFFEEFLVRGHLPRFDDSTASSEVLVSERIALALHLDTAQKLTVYFVEQPPRVRRFTIAGIYSTSFKDFDERFVMADMRHVQRLNGWTADQVGGYEIHIDEPRHIDRVYQQVQDIAAFRLQRDGTALKVEDIRQQYPSLFSWLSLLDMNILVLLMLMAAVACVNMVTAMLILILEQTKTIGLLKAMGATQGKLAGIYLIKASRILLWGLGVGNLLALLIYHSQRLWHWAKLNPVEYYVDYVPMHISVGLWLAVNVCTMVLILTLLLLPVRLIGRVSPSETIASR